MEFHFKSLATIRQFTLRQIENLTTEQLNKIPEGHNNNIVWNLGHLVVVQQILTYKLSGCTMNFPDEWLTKYAKGTVANQEISSQEIAEIKRLFVAHIEQTEEDYNNNIFKTYTKYQTSMGIELTSTKEAISFVNIHEGVHAGIILGIKKLV